MQTNEYYRVPVLFDGRIAFTREDDWLVQLANEQHDEIGQLRKFRDRVTAAITEHAGNQENPYAYIWQSEWDKIKAEAVEQPNERKDGG
jgi:hypothetical protein